MWAIRQFLPYVTCLIKWNNLKIEKNNNRIKYLLAHFFFIALRTLNHTNKRKSLYVSYDPTHLTQAERIWTKLVILIDIRGWNNMVSSGELIRWIKYGKLEEV